MNEGVKFIVAVLVLFAFFACGFWIGREDIPQELIDSYYQDGYEDGYSDGVFVMENEK